MASKDGAPFSAPQCGGLSPQTDDLGDFATADILSRVSGVSLGRTVGPAACFGQIVAWVKFLNHVAQYIFHRSMPCLRGSAGALQSLTTSPWYKGGKCSLCRIPSTKASDSCGASSPTRRTLCSNYKLFIPTPSLRQYGSPAQKA